jgi:hypothetical protein
MSIIRLYTGDDGETHLQELDLARHPGLTRLHAATGIVFRRHEAGHEMDFHVAPRRQYIITISGEVEYVLGDGSVHRFGPGHVTLAEDLTGRGHVTRVPGPEPRISAAIPISEDPLAD